MRKTLCDSLVNLTQNQKFVFMTGDLGFMALEPLRAELDSYFVNIGVSEQNLMSVAAGIASEGTPCWVYSIAPFLYARPFEQIRNDIVQHGLDVKMIGNGGGYGYGVMGSTHHALEDYGVLLTLKDLKAYVPAFSADLSSVITILSQEKKPSYLRLGRCEAPKEWPVPGYHSWRKLLEGNLGVMLVAGTMTGSLVSSYNSLAAKARPELWVVSELPINQNFPPVNEFIQSLKKHKKLLVAEEHVQQGSVGQMLAYWMQSNNIQLESFKHAFAKGYPSQRFGSQNFHRSDSGLDPKSLLSLLGGTLE